jgi:hypothetical protein
MGLQVAATSFAVGVAMGALLLETLSAVYVIEVGPVLVTPLGLFVILRCCVDYNLISLSMCDGCVLGVVLGMLMNLLLSDVRKRAFGKVKVVGYVHYGGESVVLKLTFSGSATIAEVREHILEDLMVDSLTQIRVAAIAEPGLTLPDSEVLLDIHPSSTDSSVHLKIEVSDEMEKEDEEGEEDEAENETDSSPRRSSSSPQRSSSSSSSSSSSPPRHSSISHRHRRTPTMSALLNKKGAINYSSELKLKCSNMTSSVGRSSTVTSLDGWAVACENTHDLSHVVLLPYSGDNTDGSIFHGDAVLICNKGKYLSITRGWWINWNSVVPRRSGVFRLEITEQAPQNRVNSISDHVLRSGDMFRLRSLKFPDFHLAISSKQMKGLTQPHFYLALHKIKSDPGGAAASACNAGTPTPVSAGCAPPADVREEWSAPCYFRCTLNKSSSD